MSKTLTYCFEQDRVAKTLANTAKKGLAVVDTEGNEGAVKKVVARGVYVYGYLNAGALESERRYYKTYKHLRLAKYDGWDGEFWVDVTNKAWQDHLVMEARKIKATGAIGLYLDNTDIYYMCLEGFKEEHSAMIKKAPSASLVYKALESVILRITKLGLVVMPNGGDNLVRKFISAHPGVIKTVNQEGVLYQDKKRQSKEDTKYYTEYLDWCRKKGIYIRGIEYCKTKAQALVCKAYYSKHRWQGIYISYHKDLMGD